MATRQTPKKRETEKPGEVIRTVREQLGLYLYPVSHQAMLRITIKL